MLGGQEKSVEVKPVKNIDQFKQILENFFKLRIKTKEIITGRFSPQEKKKALEDLLSLYTKTKAQLDNFIKLYKEGKLPNDAVIKLHAAGYTIKDLEDMSKNLDETIKQLDKTLTAYNTYDNNRTKPNADKLLGNFIAQLQTALSSESIAFKQLSMLNSTLKDVSATVKREISEKKHLEQKQYIRNRVSSEVKKVEAKRVLNEGAQKSAKKNKKKYDVIQKVKKQKNIVEELCPECAKEMKEFSKAMKEGRIKDALAIIKRIRKEYAERLKKKKPKVFAALNRIDSLLTGFIKDFGKDMAQNPKRERKLNALAWKSNSFEDYITAAHNQNLISDAVFQAAQDLIKGLNQLAQNQPVMVAETAPVLTPEEVNDILSGSEEENYAQYLQEELARMAGIAGSVLEEVIRKMAEEDETLKKILKEQAKQDKEIEKRIREAVKKAMKVAMKNKSAVLLAYLQYIKDEMPNVGDEGLSFKMLADKVMGNISNDERLALQRGGILRNILGSEEPSFGDVEKLLLALFPNENLPANTVAGSDTHRGGSEA